MPDNDPIEEDLTYWEKLDRECRKDIALFCENGRLPRDWDVQVRKTAPRTSAYWDHVAANGGRELVEANPDRLPEGANGRLWTPHSELAAFRAFVYSEDAGLTPGELTVYRLIYETGMLEKQAAQRLGLSRVRIAQIKRSIREKLQAEWAGHRLYKSADPDHIVQVIPPDGEEVEDGPDEVLDSMCKGGGSGPELLEP